MLGDDGYFLPERIADRLQLSLQARADGVYQAWLYDYLKRSIPCRGVRMQEIRYLVHSWYREWTAEQQIVPAHTDRAVALRLLAQPFVEDKLAAIVYLSELLLAAHKLTFNHLYMFEAPFHQGHLDNYKVCDNFAAKVLVPLLTGDPERAAVASRLEAVWLSSTSVWQARAALAALAGLAADGSHDDAILAGCRLLIYRPQEEAKSIVGTALRTLGKSRPDSVLEFLGNDENLKLFDAASLTKATANVDGRSKRRLKARRRLLVSHTTPEENTGAAEAPPQPPAGRSGVGAASTSAEEASAIGEGAGPSDYTAGKGTSPGPATGATFYAVSPTSHADEGDGGIRRLTTSAAADSLRISAHHLPELGPGDPLGVGMTLGGEMMFGGTIGQHMGHLGADPASQEADERADADDQASVLPGEVQTETQLAVASDVAEGDAAVNDDENVDESEGIATAEGDATS